MSFSSLLLIGEPLVNAGIWSGRRATTFSNDFSPEALKRILPIFHMYHPCVCVCACACVCTSPAMYTCIYFITDSLYVHCHFVEAEIDDFLEVVNVSCP